ncbi:hypothetical protein BJY52DRAFT_1229496 [Lactarius psammicola]|nr:hypothetical protein BJY52DRAFT_1229496 [Lactarius psammicola]
MTSLLHIAARLEAAVKSYVAVWDLTDGAEWKHHFEEEKVRTTREFWRVKANSGASLALPPIVAALYLVLDTEADFTEIGRNHPCLHRHTYFKCDAEFPADISDLLPLHADHWWEPLAAKSSEWGAPSEMSAPQPPSPPWRHLPRITLIVHPPAEDEGKKAPAQDEAMEVDELEESPEPSPNCKNSEKAAPEAANSKKRKVRLPLTRRFSKRHAGSSRLPPEVIEVELDLSEGDYMFELKRLGDSVIGVSKLRWNVSRSRQLLACTAKITGKTDRCNLLPEQVLKFRIVQLKKQKQKQPVRGHGKTLDASDSAASASRMVGGLTLRSASSNPNSLSPASLSPAAAGSPAAAEPTGPNVAPLATASPTPITAPSFPTAANSLSPSPAANALTSSPAAGPSPSIAPALRRHLKPAQCLQPVVEVPAPPRLASSTSWQLSDTSASRAPQAIPERNTSKRRPQQRKNDIGAPSYVPSS